MIEYGICCPFNDISNFQYNRRNCYVIIYRIDLLENFLYDILLINNQYINFSSLVDLVENLNF